MGFKISRYILVFATIISLTSFTSALAETSPEKNHISTIRMKYSSNWHSYNFSICANEKPIEPMKISVISDIETKIINFEKNIDVGNCMSFGTMIHANDPDTIYTEFAK